MTALEQIAQEADRAAEIIRRVRNFVQKTGPQVSPISLNDVVQHAATIINLELKRTGARIVCELAPDIALVEADPIQIKQVVVNLALNGLESMYEVPEAERLLGIGTRRCDEQTMEVFVRDCGKGIDPQEMNQIFEPFFTTKPEGMGMGLAICRSIVQTHKGRLWVSANNDRGCTFHFTLPAAQTAVSDFAASDFATGDHNLGRDAPAGAVGRHAGMAGMVANAGPPDHTIGGPALVAPLHECPGDPGLTFQEN